MNYLYVFFTSYYLFCVGSRSSSLRLGVQARLHETKLTAGTSNLVQNEIQRITVTASVLSEQQVRFEIRLIGTTNEYCIIHIAIGLYAI